MSKSLTSTVGWIIWFTGLSGAGKTTVARGLHQQFYTKGKSVIVLDGDQIRANRFPELGFSKSDIQKNNELIVERCIEERKLYDLVLVPIISPYRESRLIARRTLSPNFIEIYCSVSIDCVRRRDTKGLYGKETRGEVNNLIGISDSNPYEIPLTPDLVLDTESQSASNSVNDLYMFTCARLSGS